MDATRRRASRLTLVSHLALALLLGLGPAGCKGQQTRLEKAEQKADAIEKKLERLRKTQQEIEQQIPDLEARLERARADAERERERMEQGTPTKRGKQPAPNGAPNPEG